MTAGALTNVLRYRLLFVLLLAASAASAGEFCGFLAAETQFFTESHGFPEQHGSIERIVAYPLRYLSRIEKVLSANCQRTFSDSSDGSAVDASSIAVTLDTLISGTAMNHPAQLFTLHGEQSSASGLLAYTSNAGSVREAALVPSNDERADHYDRDRLLACAHGEMFGEGNAQLPLPPLLMIDRIRHISSEGGLFDKGKIIGELDITPDLWFFAAHFRGDPVMPGCFALDALWQLLGFYIAWSGGVGRGRALGVDNVRISGPVIPEHRLVTYRVHVRKLIARSSWIAIADGCMAVDGVEIYTAKSLRVGLFSSPESTLDLMAVPGTDNPLDR